MKAKLKRFVVELVVKNPDGTVRVTDEVQVRAISWTEARFAAARAVKTKTSPDGTGYRKEPVTGVRRRVFLPWPDDPLHPSIRCTEV